MIYLQATTARRQLITAAVTTTSSTPCKKNVGLASNAGNVQCCILYNFRIIISLPIDKGYLKTVHLLKSSNEVGIIVTSFHRTPHSMD